MIANKRLTFLEQMITGGSTDSFAWYGLALEYRNLERYDDALRTFTTLRDRDPGYVSMYLMCGQMLEKCARKDEARDWLQLGIEAATKKKDAHAVSELEAALEALG